MYTGDVGKRSRTFRVDEVLDDAVTAEAAKRGETVTDMFVRACEAYVRGEAYVQQEASEEPSGPAVHTPRERPARLQDEPESAASIAAWFRRER